MCLIQKLELEGTMILPSDQRQLDVHCVSDSLGGIIDIAEYPVTLFAVLLAFSHS